MKFLEEVMGLDDFGRWCFVITVVAAITLFAVTALGAPIPYKADPRTIQVIDGDTVTVDLLLGFRHKVTEDVRMCGIDAPELKTGEPGQRAKRWLISKLHKATEVVIYVDYKVRCSKLNDCERRSFRRIIGRVVADGVDLNALILKEGFAGPGKACSE